MNKQPRPAQQILNEIASGRLMAELTTTFVEAKEAVNLHGKKAIVTMTIEIAPYKKGTVHLVDEPFVITAGIDTKFPKKDHEATLFFEDEEGNLTRNQTRQRDLGLGVADIKEAKSNE
jgi:hypothetical protein